MFYKITFPFSFPPRKTTFFLFLFFSFKKSLILDFRQFYADAAVLQFQDDEIYRNYTKKLQLDHTSLTFTHAKMKHLCCSGLRKKSKSLAGDKGPKPIG